MVGRQKMDILKSTKRGDPLGRQGVESLSGGGRPPPAPPKSAPAIILLILPRFNKVLLMNDH